MSIKRAVCVLHEVPKIHPEDGQSLYLAVTRKNNKDQIGLPGGKVDPGEDEATAARRETIKETGLHFAKRDLVPLYTGFCRGEVNYWVTTYLFVGTELDDKITEPEPGIEQKVITRNELCNDLNSPFANYNCAVFAALDRYKEANNGTQ
jgi:ADP-ribose pyrophosphatase YjhB (NUDIX family)